MSASSKNSLVDMFRSYQYHMNMRACLTESIKTLDSEYEKLREEMEMLELRDSLLVQSLLSIEVDMQQVDEYMFACKSFAFTEIPHCISNLFEAELPKPPALTVSKRNNIQHDHAIRHSLTPSRIPVRKAVKRNPVFEPSLERIVDTLTP